ncbi:MAG: hypothetical protein VKO39_06240 [Cyanobacteriota bacterium]|nr:hypothetical protein [Cyanobacteriota bacterium]
MTTAQDLLSLRWGKPVNKTITGQSFSLGPQSLKITGQNRLRLLSAPMTGLFSDGLIHGAGNLALHVDVSLVSDGPALLSSGAAINNHGLMTTGSLLIKAQITGSYNSSTVGVANHGIMRNVQSIQTEDKVDGIGLLNTGILSGLNRNGYKSLITGKAYGLNKFGIGVLNRGTMETGGLLKGSGVTGIVNEGSINFEGAAEGVNKITGTGFGLGMNNAGTIKGSMYSDILTGIGGNWPQGATLGIRNSGQINLADGNDRIKARSKTGIGIIIMNPKPPFNFSPELINTGTINMGEGNDRIDVAENGISGAPGQMGRIEMGGGNDVFLGFGDDQIISGGAGIDTLRLPAGTYTFAPSTIPAPGAMEVSSVGASLLFTEFERVGLLGATKTIPFPVAGGTLTF